MHLSDGLQMIGPKEKLLIIGDGETAQLACTYFRQMGVLVAGFSVERAYLQTKTLLGLPVVALEEAQHTFNPQNYRAFVAISYTQLNHLRSRLVVATKNKGYQLATYLSPQASIDPEVEIGENCFILENTTIQRGAKIGSNVTIWAGSIIGHRTTIAPNCFLAIGVAVSGFCHIGENSFLGVNCCLSDGVHIGQNCIIGAGSVVLKDVSEGKVYAGNPAKPLQTTTHNYISGAKTI